MAIALIRSVPVTDELEHRLTRIWEDLVARPDGPLSFRFILQPVMAALLAVRDGIKDARTGRSPYFWTVLSDVHKRNARLREGMAATARIILLGLAIDAVYQIKVLGTFYPFEALTVALVLAFLPYLLLRGPVERAPPACRLRPSRRRCRRQSIPRAAAALHASDGSISRARRMSARLTAIRAASGVGLPSASAIS